MDHELASHGPPLRALPAHDERNPRRILRPRREGGLNLHAVFLDRERVEFLDELGNRAGDESETMRMMIAPVTERVSEIGQHRRIAVQINAVGQPRRQFHGASAKRIFRPGGKHYRPATFEPDVRMVRVRKERRRLRQNDVRIRAPEPERVYPGQAFAICFRERLDLGRHSQFQFVKIDVRTRRREMNAAGNFTMLKNEHRFQKSRDPGGGFEMSEVRLDGTDR